MINKLTKLFLLTAIVSVMLAANATWATLEMEPNDTDETAQMIASGETITGNLSSADDIDKADGDCYDSTIINPVPFLGNYDELFELSDGSVWKVGVEYNYLYGYYPAVIMCPNRGILEIGDITLNVTRISVSVSSDDPSATNTPLSKLQNLSTRGMVGTGDNVLIGGFIISGTELKKIVIRAKGPSLANAGLTDVLADPQMSLYSGQTIIDSNDDWADHGNVHLVPEHLIPTNRWEATIYTELAPGAYTVIVSGVNGMTGIAIFEVFEVQ